MITSFIIHDLASRQSVRFFSCSIYHDDDDGVMMAVTVGGSVGGFKGWGWKAAAVAAPGQAGGGGGGGGVGVWRKGGFLWRHWSPACASVAWLVPPLCHVLAVFCRAASLWCNSFVFCSYILFALTGTDKYRRLKSSDVILLDEAFLLFYLLHRPMSF